MKGWIHDWWPFCVVGILVVTVAVAGLTDSRGKDCDRWMSLLVPASVTIGSLRGAEEAYLRSVPSPYSRDYAIMAHFHVTRSTAVQLWDSIAAQWEVACGADPSSMLLDGDREGPSWSP